MGSGNYNDFQKIVSELLEQPELEADEILHGTVDDTRTVSLTLSANGGHNLLALTDSEGSESRTLKELESLLRTTFDGRLSHNMIGSLTTDDERSMSKIHFGAPPSNLQLEDELTVMAEFLSAGTASSGQMSSEEMIDPRDSWVQV